jgi:tetratricopeptide (TPR) repeat protein
VIASFLLVGLIPFVAPQDAWTRARELAPGQVRAELLVEALGEVGGEEKDPCLRLAYEEFMNQTGAFRLDLALPLAEAMHSTAGASWSAMCLALSSTRAGHSERAREVLAKQLERTPDGPPRYELLERLGLAHLGAGREQEARKFLGAAFARGSANAGVVLGRIDLDGGRPERARAIFRSLLDEEPSISWARRGWGLSMLPATTRTR